MAGLSTPWPRPGAPGSCGPGWHCAAAGSGSCPPGAPTAHPGLLHPCIETMHSGQQSLKGFFQLHKSDGRTST